MIFAIAVFSPLLGSLIAGFLGRSMGDRAAQAVTIALMVLASGCGVASWYAHIYQGMPNSVVPVADWISAGSFHAAWALQYDTLSVTMVAMVTCIATLIHIYSVGYMAHEHDTTSRFFSYLSLFTFAMLMLVTANNLVQLFFGWEGVGLASYLLIGYWYDRPAACRAAIKAMVVNRVGDLSFAVGIALVFLKFGAVDFPTIFAAVPQHVDESYHLFGAEFRSFEVIGFLLFIGAMGKSAQILLHTWLPDAMEGPTPVSALIHAATMVTAGVFLMARMSPILEFAPQALAFVTFIGATTCFFAATVGCVQNDIKRVIAYSTCSQLGYMFMAAGVGRLSGVDLPPFYPCLLQGASVPVCRFGDPRDVRRAGHAQDGRHLAEGPDHLRDHVDRQPGARRHSVFRRLLVQGRDPGSDLCVAFRRRSIRFCLWHHRRVSDRLLFVAPAVHDIPRKAARRSPCHGTCA